jgi:hypothetical protein
MATSRKQRGRLAAAAPPPPPCARGWRSIAACLLALDADATRAKARWFAGSAWAGGSACDEGEETPGVRSARARTRMSDGVKGSCAQVLMEEVNVRFLMCVVARRPRARREQKRGGASRHAPSAPSARARAGKTKPQSARLCNHSQGG